jgi:hypothetical protein
MGVAFVAGALANKPNSGGEAWVRLSWALGLQRLGWEVHLVERLAGEAPEGRTFFEAVVAEFDLEGRASLFDADGTALCGHGEGELTAMAADADLLFNISGHLEQGSLLAAPRRRVYVDLDPGFTQAWHADPSLEFTVDGHDHHFTVGQNIGKPGCPVPVGAIDWIHTLPPVLLEEWPVVPPPRGVPVFTTVATWRSPYGGLRIGGREMDLKHHQFRRFAELPERVEGVKFELALDIHPGDAADRELLRSHGWKLIDPRAAAGTPGAFREYLRGSRAEFSVAQGVYVEAVTGWFSDRTAAYLASGRPAVVQDTGLQLTDVTRGGAIAFDDLDAAAAAVIEVRDGYQDRARAARAFAEEHLDSARVLEAVLERAAGAGSR